GERQRPEDRGDVAIGVRPRSLGRRGTLRAFAETVGEEPARRDEQPQQPSDEEVCVHTGNLTRQRRGLRAGLGRYPHCSPGGRLMLTPASSPCARLGTKQKGTPVRKVFTSELSHIGEDLDRKST